MTTPRPIPVKPGFQRFHFTFSPGLTNFCRERKYHYSIVSSSLLSAEDDGTAVIRPKVKFDREEIKQYVIPIVVSDNPAAYPRQLTGTSLFNVIIGDENDNDMKPGSSVINVFNFEVRLTRHCKTSSLPMDG